MEIYSTFCIKLDSLAYTVSKRPTWFSSK